MESDPAAIGRRIAEARERQKLTQAQLGSAVLLDRTAVVKIESGLRGVSALELARIADELGERIEWFVRPSPDAVVSHRTMTDAPTSTLDLTLERIARDVEFVLKVDDFLEGLRPRLFDRPQSHEEAEGLAESARGLLELDDAAPASDLAQLFTTLGFLGFSHNLGRDTADAGTILLDAGAVSVVDSENKVGRRRLALAHELGHYLIADEYTVDWRVDDHSSGQVLEASLDRFARALLLPTAGVTALWRDTVTRTDTRTAALLVASTYRVDMATLARRVLDIGLGDARVAHEVRLTRTTKADIVELNLLSVPELEEVTLPTAYQLAVLRLYRNETVSAERCLELLQGTYDASDLPELPAVSDAEIWQFTS